MTTRRSFLAGLLAAIAVGPAALTAAPPEAEAQSRSHSGPPRNRPPPRPRPERRPPPRRGYVWVPGHWVWSRQRRTYVWVRGRWIRNRPGWRYRNPRWVLRGNNWVFISGGWVR